MHLVVWIIKRNQSFSYPDMIAVRSSKKKKKKKTKQTNNNFLESAPRELTPVWVLGAVTTVSWKV